jgi:hypothetical protein
LMKPVCKYNNKTHFPPNCVLFPKAPAGKGFQGICLNKDHTIEENNVCYLLQNLLVSELVQIGSLWIFPHSDLSTHEVMGLGY